MHISVVQYHMVYPCKFCKPGVVERKVVPLTLTRCNSHQFQIASENNIRIKKSHSPNCSEKCYNLIGRKTVTKNIF